MIADVTSIPNKIAERIPSPIQRTTRSFYLRDYLSSNLEPDCVKQKSLIVAFVPYSTSFQLNLNLTFWARAEDSSMARCSSSSNEGVDSATTNNW
jgi:hypothetical protein